MGLKKMGRGQLRLKLLVLALPKRLYSVSSGTESVSPASMEDLAEEADEPEAQVHDWRFSELRTTDLAALREVDVAAPFRLPVIDDEHWKGLDTTPNRHGPQRSRNAWYDATAHWAALKGLARSKHPTKQQLNSFWFKLYHGTSKKSEPSALAAALATFPFYRDEGVAQYRQTGRHSDDVVCSSSLNEATHRGLHSNWHP